MPKIEWRTLPTRFAAICSTERMNARISEEDLILPSTWRDTNPTAPDGLWFKDFGSFKLCGEGKYPKTFLLRGQLAKGKEL
jgi:hypothetical protein